MTVGRARATRARVAGPVWTIVVAGGSGARFGGEKQFATLGGRRLVDRAVAAARTVSDGVVAVVPPGRSAEPVDGADAIVTGGATRSESVRAGLAAVPGDAEVIVVHDAARPLADSKLFSATVAAVVAGADGAVPGIPIPDTIKRVSADGPGPARVEGTIPRDGLVVVQTPQAFRASVLRHAHASKADGTDDAQLVESAGGIVVVVPGDPRNFKVTTPADLAMAESAVDADPASVVP